MKNIHILPTDKPSRLVKNHTNKLLLTIQYLPLNKEIYCFPQNIYITSDEKIKEENYSFYPPFGVGKNIVINRELCFHIESKNGKGSFTQRTYQTLDLNKKIILTTDQDLINDGVQAIDDEFLKWFVKNSSCESVEVKSESSRKFGMWKPECYPQIHKIIIPKEEPKQTIQEYEQQGLEKHSYELEPKQEKPEPIVYHIGDNIRIINPTENQPKLFTTHKIDNDFGVVYYYQLDGKEESIGFSYIKKEESKQEIPQLGTKEFNDLASVYFGGKPKQEYIKSKDVVLGYKTSTVAQTLDKLVNKQETLEEVAEKEIPNRIRSTAFGSKFEWEPTKERKAFIRGAKWQAERMYSKEDMYKLMDEYQDYLVNTDEICKTFKEWYIKNKKKLI